MMKKLFRIYKKSFTLKRFTNLIKILCSYALSLAFRKPIVWGYPPVVMIEPTNYCNLKCPLCPSGADLLTRERGYITFELFTQVIDEVADTTFMLIFWNQGEPFLHPDFCKMVSYAHKKKIYVMVSTNANIMPPAEEIIIAGLDELIISLDGATQETYNKYRQNGSLDKVLDNLKDLISVRSSEFGVRSSDIEGREARKPKASERKPKTPYIIWQFLVMRHNEHEIATIQSIAKEIGVDKLSFKTVQIFTKDDIENYLPRNPKYSRYRVIDNCPLSTKYKNRCYRLWYQPVINWDGEMSVCCYDKDNFYKIGNIKAMSFYELWTSKPLMTFRKTILKDRKRYEICRNCGEGVKLEIRSEK